MVVAILALLAALLFPVLSSSKRSAKVSASTSNMHQVWLALQLYSDDWGSRPVGDAALLAVRGAPTCDPLDYWRANCQVELGAPMLGSYAYAKHVPLFQEQPASLAAYEQSVENPALLISIFAADGSIPRFQGEKPPVQQCRPTAICAMPAYVLVAFDEGSVRRVDVAPSNPTASGAFPLFTWSSLFYAANRESRP